MIKFIRIFIIGCLSLFMSAPLLANVTWEGHCRDRKPYLYFENGECKGPGGDVINQVILKLGHKVHWTKVPWARTIGVAPQGGVDLIPLHSMDEEREQFLHPLLMGYGEREVFYFTRTNSDIDANSFDEIVSRGFVIGALNGSFYSDQFNQNTDKLKISFVTSVEQIINMLEASRIDLAITSEQHGLNLFENDPKLKKISYKNIYLNGRFFSVPKRSANYQYIDQLENILTEMRRSGEITRIYESYNLEAPIQKE
ncbi:MULTISPECIES: substrate-binding periplasmic protein [Vibrio]|uniref:ABC transporter substrate-binding protein n=5 Tax=Vibrio TaxID=662 RepID=A0AAW4BBX6_VIBAN|nr:MULTISPECIES: transporter substrate-binding domain-containing protein [Vibrio]MBF4376182.1 ABC transporter substrate-binding protein [Vibrio anguillarum]MBF4435605.1 transporter substrate-binding domain-containing protein [Vibrio anguillarum]NAW90408.1 transporter substrate-binding domain-containing protein [Vibrio sp. V24_P1S3T111]OXX19334.1 ABC transporter substrate-binding protein [Vibrio sp. V06_P1A73T115]OXX34184.1 ABC transporter substrate-binding protein [Vibrio sp. V14_P6S14T42]